MQPPELVHGCSGLLGWPCRAIPQTALNSAGVQTFWGGPCRVPPQRASPEGTPFGFTPVPQKDEPCNQAETVRQKSSVAQCHSGKFHDSMLNLQGPRTTPQLSLFDLEGSEGFGQFSQSAMNLMPKRGNASAPNICTREGPRKGSTSSAGSGNVGKTPLPAGDVHTQ